MWRAAGGRFRWESPASRTGRECGRVPSAGRSFPNAPNCACISLFTAAPPPLLLNEFSILSLLLLISVILIFLFGFLFLLLRLFECSAKRLKSFILKRHSVILEQWFSEGAGMGNILLENYFPYGLKPSRIRLLVLCVVILFIFVRYFAIEAGSLSPDHTLCLLACISSDERRALISLAFCYSHCHRFRLLIVDLSRNKW